MRLKSTLMKHLQRSRYWLHARVEFAEISNGEVALTLVKNISVNLVLYTLPIRVNILDCGKYSTHGERLPTIKVISSIT